MKTEKLVSLFDLILLVVLAIAMVFFFIGSVGTFSLGNTGQVFLLIYLLLTYAIILILVLKFKGIFLTRIRERTLEVPVDRVVEKPVLKVVEKVVEKPVIKTVYVDKTKEPVKKFKFYGSTLQNTYHKEKCRFSGMIKKEHLVLRNTNTYFKKNKFRACKNCHPERKK